MAGAEREFMGTMEMLPPRESRDHRYLEPDNSMMRDFWRSTSDRESLQEMRDSEGRGEHTIHRMEDNPSLNPYSRYTAHHQLDNNPTESEVVGTRSSLGSSHHDAFFTDYHAYHHLGDPDAATSGALISAHSTYTNFFNTVSCVEDHDQPHHHHGHSGLMKHEPNAGATYMTASPENNNNTNNVAYQYNGAGRAYSSLPPVAIPLTHEVYATTTASESINRDQEMESLRRELAFKCPRSSELLMAITSTADVTAREHRSVASGVSSDDDDAPDELEQNDPSLAENDQDLRAAIVDHPYYPEMVVAHIRIFKIGAPKELRNKLDEVTKKFQRFQDPQGSTMRLGEDASLDFFMRSYVDLLSKLGEDLEEPFNKFMQFKDATTKSLENICGHYIETAPDETDNYGFDIGPVDGGQESDELDMLGDEGLAYSCGDVDESIVVDPSAPDDELRKMLMMKYGRHIGGLKAEFNRVRKKGKLPSNARSILKDWFNRHSYWPYPSEVEKQYLQRICALNLKQINNWFINERKRHWSCEGKCMHPNAKFYNSNDGNGHAEQME